MNDLAFLSRSVVEDEGRVDLQRIDELTNEAPMGLLGMNSPRRALRSLLVPQGSA